MRLLIVTNPGSSKVTEIENYTGPVPRVGEYIYHRSGPGVCSVKTVTYLLFDSDWNSILNPTVEICI